jgi:polyhydroxyalkanoate synthesis regulator phasin
LRYHEESEPQFPEVSMRGTVGETLERLILLQVGAAAATRDRVQEVVDSLIEQGRIEREEGRTVVNDVMNRARERSAGARSLVDASVQQGLRRGGLPTREDHEDLVFRVEQLEHRVRMLEDRPAAPTTGASPPAGGPEGVTGGPEVAHPPPRDEPGTPPGL